MGERIDAHAHVFLTRPASWTGDRGRRVGQATAEDFLTTLDWAGVDRAVLIALQPGDPYTRASLDRYPHRFRGIDLYQPGGGSAQVRASAAAGFGGLRAFALLGDDEASARTALRLMADLGLVLWLWPESSEAGRLASVLADTPELRIVLNHFARTRDASGEAGACPDPRLLRLAEHPGCHLLLASHFAVSRESWPYADLSAPSQSLIARFGAERVLWGSNYPLVLADEDGYARSLELVRRHVPQLPDRDLDLVLGGNVRRLFIWS